MFQPWVNLRYISGYYYDWFQSSILYYFEILSLLCTRSIILRLHAYFLLTIPEVLSFFLLLFDLILKIDGSIWLCGNSFQSTTDVVEWLFASGFNRCGAMSMNIFSAASVIPIDVNRNCHWGRPWCTSIMRKYCVKVSAKKCQSKQRSNSQILGSSRRKSDSPSFLSR